MDNDTPVNINNNNNSNSTMARKVFNFASESLRKAGSVLFDASSRMTNTMDGIFIADLCDALEGLGPIYVDVGDDDVKPASSNVAIPSNDVGADGGVESMSVSTTSGFDSSKSSLRKSDSEASFEVVKEEEATPEVDDDKKESLSSSSSLPIISMEEVGDHYAQNDAWMVIYDKVYDFTDFMQEHPGGWEIMQEYVGYDGTIAFRGVGHSAAAMKMMEPYLIGILPECERLYSNRWQW